MTGDLVAFLRERYDEDEQAARATTVHQPYDEWTAVGVELDDDIARSIWEVPKIARRWEHTPATRPIMEHIARHDPARVLAEVDAKRRLLALHVGVILRGGPGAKYYDNTTVCRSCAPPQFAEHAWPCPTLRLLALPYRDHPDYQPDWEPK